MGLPHRREGIGEIGQEGEVCMVAGQIMRHVVERVAVGGTGDDASTENVGTMGEMGWKSKAGVMLKASEMVLEGVEGVGVGGRGPHGIIVCEIRMVSGTCRYLMVCEEIGIVRGGVVFVERKDRRVLHTGDGVAWGEGGDLS